MGVQEAETVSYKGAGQHWIGDVVLADGCEEP